jgi:hypothetical protein
MDRSTYDVHVDAETTWTQEVNLIAHKLNKLMLLSKERGDEYKLSDFMLCARLVSTQRDPEGNINYFASLDGWAIETQVTAPLHTAAAVVLLLALAARRSTAKGAICPHNDAIPLSTALVQVAAGRMVAMSGPVRCRRSMEEIERTFGERLRKKLGEQQGNLMVQWLALNLVAHFGAPRPHVREWTCRDVALLYLPHARRVLADKAFEQIRGPLRPSISSLSDDALEVCLGFQCDLVRGRFDCDAGTRLHAALRYLR